MCQIDSYAAALLHNLVDEYITGTRVRVYDMPKLLISLPIYFVLHLVID